MKTKEGYANCDKCTDEEVDADYTCGGCKKDICFDHMKIWPQPKWVEVKPIHYCDRCYQNRWELKA